MRVLLKDGVAIASLDDAFDIIRSQPHGHVAAVHGFARTIGLDRLLGPRSRLRDLARQCRNTGVMLLQCLPSIANF